MREYTIDKIRNIGLIGHGDAGKTTLSEAMLFASGESNRFGSVDDGTTISDYSSDEIERKISITTSLLNVDWENTKINILDTPGYFDFLGEVKSGLRAADLAVILLNGVSGVEVGTDIGWEILQDYDKPRLFYINHLNREHADFEKTFEDTKEAYGNAVVAVNFPVNEGEGFNSVIDLLRMKKVTFSGDSGKYTQEDIPADLQDKAENLHTEFIEKIAECDDEILEKYFEEGELSEKDIVKGITAGLVSKSIFPVLCGSASKNVGTQLLMDFIAGYCPSPADVSPFSAEEDGKDIELNAEDNGEFSGFVFKTLSELHVGELSCIRAFSGSVKTGDEVLNTTRDASEKIGQIYTLNGKDRKEIGILNAGDIGALVKLKETHTGDTLSSKKKKLKFKPVEFFTPVYEIAISPKSKGDEDKISTGLHTLNEIDPSFNITIDPELHQTVIAGKGEVHLAVILKRLKERFGVEVVREKTKIPYRETITGKADEKYRHKKQSGGAGQFAEVWMRIEPRARGEGFEFENKVVGGSISSGFIPSVEKGVKQVITEGAVAGYKIVDVRATVYDGKEHPVDSKDIAFQIAGREVFKMAVKNAKPILLEPIYNVEVKCPEGNMGDIMGDISTRRGKIQGMESAGRFQVVKAKIPLAELNDYSTSLRSMTQGRATYSREFSHYDPLQKDVEAKVIAESQAEKEN